MSPTARTLAALRREGYIAGVVEARVPGRPWITRDLYVIVDVMAFHPDRPGVLAIQATTAANLGAREVKAKAEPRAALWCRAGMGRRLQLWGWRKVGERGKRKRWAPRIIEMYDGALTGLEREGAGAQAPTPGVSD